MSVVVPVVNWSGDQVGDLNLSPHVFGREVKESVISGVVRWQMAKARSGTHQVKNRGDVSASTRKVRRQKGSGRSRVGAVSVPHWRSGGVVFGPQVRDHSFGLPKKVRSLALRMVLSSRLASGSLVVVESLPSYEGTAALGKSLDSRGWRGALIVGEEIPRGLSLAARNLSVCDVLPLEGINVVSILRRSRLIVSKGAVLSLEQRLSGQEVAS